MKIGKQQVPMNQIKVTQGDRSIFIFTHRQTIHLSAYQNHDVKESHEFTFDQLHALICKLQPGIQNHV